MSSTCSNGHDIPAKGPGQHTNGRTVCRPCEDAGKRYRVTWTPDGPDPDDSFGPMCGRCSGNGCSSCDGGHVKPKAPERDEPDDEDSWMGEECAW